MCLSLTLISSFNLLLFEWFHIVLWNPMLTAVATFLKMTFPVLFSSVFICHLLIVDDEIKHWQWLSQLNLSKLLNQHYTHIQMLVSPKLDHEFSHEFTVNRLKVWQLSTVKFQFSTNIHSFTCCWSQNIQRVPLHWCHLSWLRLLLSLMSPVMAKAVAVIDVTCRGYSCCCHWCHLSWLRLLLSLMSPVVATAVVVVHVTCHGYVCCCRWCHLSWLRLLLSLMSPAMATTAAVLSLCMAVSAIFSSTRTD